MVCLVWRAGRGTSTNEMRLVACKADVADVADDTLQSGDHVPFIDRCCIKKRCSDAQLKGSTADKRDLRKKEAAYSVSHVHVPWYPVHGLKLLINKTMLQNFLTCMPYLIHPINGPSRSFFKSVYRGYFSSQDKNAGDEDLPLSSENSMRFSR